MTQLRRNIPAPLAALLDSSLALTTADLVTVTLSGGEVLRWTSFDQPVTVSGQTWVMGPGLETGRMKWSAGIEVDTLQITLRGDVSTLINGVAMMPFINGGGFDGATFQVWRAYAADPASGWVGKLHRFTGKVSDIDRPSRVEASVTVRSVFELLNQQLPRNVYQAQCDATLYDSTCGVNRAAYTVGTTVSVSNDPLRLTFTGSALTQADGHFNLGAVRFTSGANAGVLRTVRSQVGGLITLVQPLPLPAAVGDSFDIYPGCDLTMATCQGKFNNVIRFRGQPFIPVAETVL